MCKNRWKLREILFALPTNRLKKDGNKVVVSSIPIGEFYLILFYLYTFKNYFDAVNYWGIACWVAELKAELISLPERVNDNIIYFTNPRPIATLKASR